MKFRKEPTLELELEDDSPSKGNSTIISIYALLCFSIICMFVPIGSVMIMGSFMILFTLFLAWCLRYGKTEDSLIYNHMIYISRTIWMWSLIASITTSIAGFMVFTMADNSIYDKMIDDMMQGISYSHAMAIEALMTYIQTNFPLLLCAGLICAAPIFGYIIYRVYHGFSRALKGYRVANAKAWF